MVFILNLTFEILILLSYSSISSLVVPPANLLPSDHNVDSAQRT